MAVRFQITVDCENPATLVAFWAEALGYVVQPPPDGFKSWNAYWRSVGVPDDELDDAVDASDSIVDPSGKGPRIWFQKVPERKSVKNRLHLDVLVGGGRGEPIQVRRARVEERVEDLLRFGARRLRSADQHDLDHYFVVMQDPEGNEFCVV